MNVHFSENDAAKRGGALYANHCAPTLTHCTFWENTVTSTSCVTEDDCGGGAIYLTCDSEDGCDATTPTITNCSFANNNVAEHDYTDCGGVYSNRSSDPSSGAVTVVNTVFWDNNDDDAGTDSEAANILENAGATTNPSENYPTLYS